MRVDDTYTYRNVCQQGGCTQSKILYQHFLALNVASVAPYGLRSSRKNGCLIAQKRLEERRGNSSCTYSIFSFQCYTVLCSSQYRTLRWNVENSRPISRPPRLIGKHPLKSDPGMSLHCSFCLSVWRPGGKATHGWPVQVVAVSIADKLCPILSLHFDSMRPFH